MIESPARIRRTEGDTAWVVSEAPSSCGACAGKGCGSSLFARFWHADEAEFAVANPIGASAGEAVVVGLPEGSLLRAALSSYGIALLMLLTGAGLGAYLFGEPGAIGGGLSGLTLAGLLLKYQSDQSRNPQAFPVILRRGNHSGCRKSASR